MTETTASTHALHASKRHKLLQMRTHGHLEIDETFLKQRTALFDS